jgi:hypothetical protein
MECLPKHRIQMIILSWKFFEIILICPERYFNGTRQLEGLDLPGESDLLRVRNKG